MNANQITLGIMREKRRFIRNFCLPRYTPDNWWECDVFEVTAKGYFREYEVKTSRADFRRDAVKPDKHLRLAAGCSKGPTQFWFVVPAGLILPHEVPTWAGLLEAHGTTAKRYLPFIRETKPAPKLHRTLMDPEIHDHARGVCYYRLHSVWAKQSQAKNFAP